MRRILALGLTLWYATASLGMAEAAVQLRQAGPPVAAAFACAGHRCGCRTAQQCLRRCCCKGKTPAPQAVIAAHGEGCHGEMPDDAAPGTLSRLGPHEPPVRAIAAPADLVGAHALSDPRWPALLAGDPPEKVPLSAA